MDGRTFKRKLYSTLAKIERASVAIEELQDGIPDGRMAEFQNMSLSDAKMYLGNAKIQIIQALDVR